MKSNTFFISAIGSLSNIFILSKVSAPEITILDFSVIGLLKSK